MIRGRLLVLGLLVAARVVAAPMPATGTVEAAFTPWDDAEGLLISTLKEARREVLVQAYTLTSRTIAAALQEAKARGAEVRLLADRDQIGRGNDTSLIPFLATTGIPVRLETRYNAAHNKVMLIDAESELPIVITGSYNFTWSAQARNAENLLVLKGNGPLARAYRSNWLRQWEEAAPFDGSKMPEGPPRTRNSTSSTCLWLSPEEKRLLGKECHSRPVTR